MQISSMGVEDARRRFNRIVLSLFVTIVGTVLLSYLFSVTGGERFYSGQASLNPVIFSGAFIIAMLTIGILFLRSGVSGRSK